MHWNGVTGVGNIGAVGQLIPAIIGIGGLLRVGWIWWSKGDVSETEGNEVGKDVLECVELYQKLKKEREEKVAMRNTEATGG